jgi:outer membrane protein assembly factor BamE (lipoprotein component of BamABCDE complex)
MKKIFSLLLVSIAASMVLTGCNSVKDEEPPASATQGGNVVKDPALTGADSAGGGPPDTRQQTQTGP